MPMPQHVKDAAFGLGVTLLPIFVLACVQYLSAPYTMTVVYMNDPQTEAWAVQSWRHILVIQYAVIALLIAACWLPVAKLGGARFLRIGSANIFLALAILIYAYGQMEVTFLGSESPFRGLCPLAGLPAEPRGYGIHMTRCDKFVGDVSFFLFFGVPLLLLATSFVLRIILSRRRYADGAASAVQPRPRRHRQ
ncbi:MAG TPA: hypothetical protein VMG08_21425 [Allosphingosinicella sp.]|nr:hypothetical protein [Allosphingosinicella sp.]